MASCEPGPASSFLQTGWQALSSISASLILLPELYFSGGDIAPAASDGDLIQAISQRCKQTGKALAFGYEEACSGQIFNAVQLIDSSGTALANYRCSHPNSTRHGIGRWLTIFPFKRHRLALLAGDDLLVPEIWRALALEEVSLVVWLGSHQHAQTLLAARALENRISAAGYGPQGLYFAGHDGQIHGPSPAIDAVAPPPGLPVKRQPVLYQRLTSD